MPPALIEIAAPASRDHRKLRTREALLAAALHLLGDNKSFDSLSLREVTREVGIVPTAFYRHFDSMEALGLALVDEALRALRQPLREARSQLQPTEMTIRQSIHILAAHIHSQKPLFRFISRERQGGMAVIRQAIRQELRLFVSELALDLSRLSVFNHWSSQDLQMMASLTVNAMVSITEQISDLSSPQPELEREILGLAEKQLRLIFLGVPHWRSGKTSPKASNAA